MFQFLLYAFSDKSCEAVRAVVRKQRIVLWIVHKSGSIKALKPCTVWVFRSNPGNSLIGNAGITAQKEGSLMKDARCMIASQTPKCRGISKKSGIESIYDADRFVVS